MSSHDGMIVVDANVVVDLALELAGVRTGRRDEIEALLNRIGRDVVIDGETVRIRPVLSWHIVTVARGAVARYLGAEQADRMVVLAFKRLMARHGTYDPTVEDYQALARRCWARCGTDTEDEAVLACAERHHAAVVTNDADFRQYLGDLKVAAWSVATFAADAVKI